MSCQRPVLCTRPSTPLKDWMVYSHQVLRVIWVPPGESRQVLGGLLAVSVLISMLVMFMFWKTNPTCRLQDECLEACKTAPTCPNKNSRYSNMTVIVWKKPSVESDEWNDCKASAIKWQTAPKNPNTDLVCYFPMATDENTLECLEPLQGDACAQEKKYMKMLSGASSVVILFSFMLVPRALEFLFSVIFGVCCSSMFLKTQGKTVKGVSLGVMILAGLAIVVALFILNGGSGFIGLRLGVWAATWIGSMLIFEPLTGILTYYLIRCDNKNYAATDAPEIGEHETRPLLDKTALVPPSDSDGSPLPTGLVTTLPLESASHTHEDLHSSQETPLDHSDNV